MAAHACPTSQLLPTWLSILLALLFSCQAPKETPEENKDYKFSRNIRKLAARTPEAQQAAFRLPPGFKIELFASEPDIGKPMNISFDERGRLWVTQSSEYPFYDSLGTGPDKISILEDTDNDGRADRFITFVDSLNIPIGVVPVADGAIAYSIPNVYHFIDSNGDDKADDWRVLLSGFEYKDTHGMINNLYRGLDGFIHANHGFSNVSKVVGADNQEPLIMKSGNTFRFLPDGSKLAFTTTGRVNPFGYAMDEYGYMYSVDCHTSPIYQLIRGADYPHFGKQPTGIGFGPALMKHNHGATALAGLEYYTGEQYPIEYQQNFYLGDVVKSRVYRGSMEMNGTTPVITWEEDFIISEDPWFRPVDVKLGPDGALYVADFYNRIIGHYEVALDHPGRDRSRGRIWRITYEPNQAHHQPMKFSNKDLPTLLKLLSHKAINIRMQAADQIVDRYGPSATDRVKDMLNNTQLGSDQFIHGLWILFRLNELDQHFIEAGLNHSDERCRVHTLRVLFELSDLDETLIDKVRTMLIQTSPHVRRAAIMVLTNYPNTKNIRALLRLKSEISDVDNHLSYALRQCLRDQLRDQKVLKWVNEQEWSEFDSGTLADVMLGVSDYGIVPFLSKHIYAYHEPVMVLESYVEHIARFLPVSEQNSFVYNLRELTIGDLDLQYRLFLSLENGVRQRGNDIQNSGRTWAIDIAKQILDQPPTVRPWVVLPIDDNYQTNPWSLDQIEIKDSLNQVLISGPQSGPGISTSEIKSPVFSLEGTLSFTLFGNKRPPTEENEPLVPNNWVELYLVGQDQAVFRKEITEIGQQSQISWELDSLDGNQGYILLRDGSQQWNEFIALGDMNHSDLTLPSYDPGQLANRQVFALKVAKEYKVIKFSQYLETLLTSPSTDLVVRYTAAEALLSISTKNNALVAPVASNLEEPEILRMKLLESLIDAKIPSAYETCRNALKQISFGNQKALMLLMAGHSNGINGILNAAEALDISPKLLLDPQISSTINVNSNNKQKTDYRRLTENIQPFSEDTQQMIDHRMIGFPKMKTSLDIGSHVFQRNCAQCHQIRGIGGDIGPQLDGIGNRGLQALIEKVLDPNRNISKAFINYSIELTNGGSKQGLYRRDEGSIKVFADVNGQEFSIASNEIRAMRALPFTLMPGNFAESIPEEEFYHLMEYLISQK